jgi:ABC-type uncharacterized transport system substrate-binding protein
MPVDVGFLYSGSPQSLRAQYDAFVNALPPGTSIFPNNAVHPGDVQAPAPPGKIRQVIQDLLNLTPPVQALLVTADPMFNDMRSDVTKPGGTPLSIPAIYQWREFVVDDGGLMSYGPSLVEEYTAAGNYVAAILRREDPKNIPLYQPIKFEFVLNSNTAKALGLKLPATLLAIAEVI